MIFLPLRLAEHYLRDPDSGSNDNDDILKFQLNEPRDFIWYINYILFAKHLLKPSLFCHKIRSFENFVPFRRSWARSIGSLQSASTNLTAQMAAVNKILDLTLIKSSWKLFVSLILLTLDKHDKKCEIWLAFQKITVCLKILLNTQNLNLFMQQRLYKLK